MQLFTLADRAKPPAWHTICFKKNCYLEEKTLLFRQNAVYFSVDKKTTMKKITTKEKYGIVLNIAGLMHEFLFDGEKVYDTTFPAEEIVKVKVPCGFFLNQSEVAQICKEKMKDMVIVQSALNGEYIAEHKDTPKEFSLSNPAVWEIAY